MERKTLFKAEKISKQYAGTAALKNIDLEINAGEVVGLIGENGAGKSTLLKIISGVEQPTTGSMELHGKAYVCTNPIAANEMGIGMVFQEQSLIRNLTVAQNIFLGRESRYKKFGLIDWKSMNKAATQALNDIGVNNIAPDKKIVDLNFATRQMVEIAKVFNIVNEKNHGGSIILLDEPTSVLNDAEIKQLFEQMELMKKTGNSVIFVSHRLDEVIHISDRIYIFKDGENTGVLDKEDANESVLYEKMVGRSTTGEYFKIHRQTIPQEEVVLEVAGLSQAGAFKNINFKLHKGEVLGICGVVGSGKEELCSVICGDEDYTAGKIVIKGEERTLNSTAQALSHGILTVPKERREESIIGILSIFDNVTMSSLKNVCVSGIISKKKQIEVANKWIKKLAIKCSGVKQRISRLSGGNAQKVVFARAMESNADIIILNHPTRGVDVGSKEDIYNLVRDISEKGTAVILLGDTLDECIGLSSKVLVMKDGLVVSEYDCGADNKPSQVDIVKDMM